MSVTRLACATVLFLSGLGVGAFWCPFRSSPQKVDSGAVSDPQPEREKFVAKMKEIYGEECGEFVRQFEDMTIRLNKYPIVVSASPDGRFVIRLFGSGELIASDLRCPERGGTLKELVRHYSFSCNGRTYSCDFGRSIEGPKVVNVVFAVTDAKGNPEFSYVDTHGDGRWDRFADYTHKPATFYERDGLCWKERKVAGDKAPKGMNVPQSH